MINTRPVYFSLPAPDVIIENNVIIWENVKDAVSYRILKNGKQVADIKQTSFQVTENFLAEYQVIAIDKNKIGSFASEPLLVAAEKNIKIVEAESFAEKAGYNYKGYTGKGFVEISLDFNRKLEIPVNIEQTGWYSIDYRYANGNGPINTENKCAIRSLFVDGKQKGTMVFPHRGTNEWSNWGNTNVIKLYLGKGKHNIALQFEDYDDNMSGRINQAMIDNMRLIQMEKQVP
jgi:hypothetical protein